MTFSRVAVIVTITAVLVYMGLNVLLPHHDKDKAAGEAVSADEVFSAPAAPAAETTEAAAGSAPAPDAAPAAEAAPAATSEAGAAPAADASAAGGLTEEEARKIAENVSREVATRVAESAAAPAPAPTAAEPEAPAPAPAPAPEVAAAPEPAPAPEPAAASSAGSPYEAAVRETNSNLSDADVQRIAAEVARKIQRSNRRAAAPAAETASAEPAAAKPKKAAAKPAAAATSTAAAPSGSVSAQKGSLDTISAWWPAASKVSSDRLSLVYAGEAASEKAVVLMFASDLGDAATAGSNITVLDDKGAPAGGTWSAGGNPRLLVYRGVKPGRYTVILKPTLADASGKTLGGELHGPVYVH